MKSKNELIRAIDIKLKSNLTNALLSKELNQELLKKNLNVNLTGALFNGLKEVIDLTNEELIMVAKVFYNYFKDEKLNPKEYFNERQILDYELIQRPKEEKISLMEFENVIKINDTSYVAFVGAEKLYDYFTNGLFIYDRRVQREPRIRLLGKNYLVKEISLNKNAVKEIEQEMLNRTYEPDAIILNVLMMEGKSPNVKYENGSLFITPNLDVNEDDTTIVQLTDGMHRVSALVGAVNKLKKNKEDIPDDMGLIVKITIKTLEEAKRITVQSFKRSATSTDYLKSLETDDYTKLTDALIKELPTSIKEKIFPTYVECIYSHGIFYKTLITDTLRLLLPKEKNFLFNLQIVTYIGKNLGKILGFIVDEYYIDLSGCINNSNLLKINSIVYWLTFLYELHKANIEEEKFIKLANNIVMSSATWDEKTLTKKKVRVNELIEEAKEILEEEILND